MVNPFVTVCENDLKQIKSQILATRFVIMTVKNRNKSNLAAKETLVGPKKLLKGAIISSICEIED